MCAAHTGRLSNLPKLVSRGARGRVDSAAGAHSTIWWPFPVSMDPSPGILGVAGRPGDPRGQAARPAPVQPDSRTPVSGRTCVAQSKPGPRPRRASPDSSGPSTFPARGGGTGWETVISGSLGVPRVEASSRGPLLTFCPCVSLPQNQRRRGKGHDALYQVKPSLRRGFCPWGPSNQGQGWTPTFCLLGAELSLSAGPGKP